VDDCSRTPASSSRRREPPDPREPAVRANAFSNASLSTKDEARWGGVAAIEDALRPEDLRTYRSTVAEQGGVLSIKLLRHEARGPRQRRGRVVTHLRRSTRPRQRFWRRTTTAAVRSVWCAAPCSRHRRPDLQGLRIAVDCREATPQCASLLDPRSSTATRSPPSPASASADDETRHVRRRRLQARQRALIRPTSTRPIVEQRELRRAAQHNVVVVVVAVILDEQASNGPVPTEHGGRGHSSAAVFSVRADVAFVRGDRRDLSSSELYVVVAAVRSTHVKPRLTSGGRTSRLTVAPLSFESDCVDLPVA